MAKIVGVRTPLTKEAATVLRAGDVVSITGHMYTARDAAHKRLVRLVEEGKELPSQAWLRMWSGWPYYQLSHGPLHAGIARERTSRNDWQGTEVRGSHREYEEEQSGVLRGCGRSSGYHCQEYQGI